MPELIQIAEPINLTTECLEIRRANFGDAITFHAPGLRKYKTDEFDSQNAIEFVSISVTGTARAELRTLQDECAARHGRPAQTRWLAL
jgi:hypothetical protein